MAALHVARGWRLALGAAACLLLLISCAEPRGAGNRSAADVGTTMLPPSAAAETTDAAEIARLVRAAGLPPCPGNLPEASPREDGLPDLTLPCLGAGPDVNLSALRGSPLVVNVWASWCPPCAAEMPYLLAAQKALGNQVRFLGIDLVDRRSAALAWARDFAMTFPSVQDQDGLVRSRLRVMAPPVTLLVRPDGSLAKTHYGAFSSAKHVRAAIAEHLGVAA
jgi:cytochrome c biogenesis protein CcmG, thiol:disulfide interchange protein DsbE